MQARRQRLEAKDLARHLMVTVITIWSTYGFGQDGGVRFSESNSLLRSLDLTQGLAECQPLRGDGAQILERSKADGVEAARVLSGRCNDVEEWAGLARLESAGAQR